MAKNVLIAPALSVLIIIPPAYVGAWLNENYVESSAMQKRWPLHPKPYSNETLERYVRRLAECYDVRYEHFADAHLAYLPTIVRQGDFRNPHGIVAAIIRWYGYFCWAT